jgi:hypothetical protein
MLVGQCGELVVVGMRSWMLPGKQLAGRERERERERERDGDRPGE